MTFEVSVDPDAALRYKKGELQDLGEVLHADNIFTDAKKGLLASQEDLRKVFTTTDKARIAGIIIKEGEIQFTAEHRAQEREHKRRRLISMICRQAIDPRTGFPHPAERIEAALEQGKIHLDDYRSVEEQFDEIVFKIRAIVPIKIEQKKITLTIPAQFAGKSYAVVKSNSAIIKDAWNNDGSWTAVVEIPAGFYQEFLDKLNSLTHGEVVVKE